MAGVQDFLSQLQGGGARPNRFEVVVNFPAFAAGADEIRKTSFLATATQIPGSTLGTIEQNFRGRPLKMAGDRTFEEWEVTFLNDTDFSLHDAFERWHNGINTYNSNLSTSPDEYYSTVSVYQLDGQDNRIKEFNLLLAWPSNIGPIELAQDSNNAIETFSTTFQYSDIDNGNSN